MPKVPKSLKNSMNLIPVQELYEKASQYIEIARSTIQRSIDTEMVKAYWSIGKSIVEEEQKGKSRAKYGQSLVESLSVKLVDRYGKGFSVPNIRNMRQFYLEYQNLVEKDLIHYAVRSELKITEFQPVLSWTHYRSLMRVKRRESRSFYEIEALKNNWSSRELDRQIESLLYERLAKSKDKKQLLALSQRGQEINNPADAVKDPVVLEFLGIPEAHQLTESKLETALITNLQKFLLELGKGFAFIARQKRLTLDRDHFYSDLIFYHVILKCYVVIDIKVRKLTHGDLGQMQLYVNYFDQEVKMKTDNPTIGLILCTEKNDTMVQYTLGDKGKQIFASKYHLYLPTEEELEKELKREIKEIKNKGLSS